MRKASVHEGASSRFWSFGGFLAAARAPAVEAVADFAALLQRERACADRHGHGFAVLAFDVGDAEEDAVSPQGLGRTLRGRLRSTDSVGWLGDGRLGVLLPFTDAEDGSTVAEELSELLGAELGSAPWEVFPYRPRFGGAVETRGPDDGDGREDRGARGDRGDRGDRGAGAGRRRDSAELAPGAARAPGRPRKPRGEGARQDGRQGGTRHGGQPPFLTFQPLPPWKRGMDICGALFGLALFAPVMVAIVILIKLTSPGPAVFAQKRTGQNLRRFKMYKFRTMEVGAHKRVSQLGHLNEMDGPLFKTHKDPRRTRVGSFLRKTSLDELPQFLNVLKGDMTLIGPRALSPLPSEYEPWQLRRFTVVPGMACTWQASRRAETDFVEWMRSDLRYIDAGVTPLKDLRLLVATLLSVVTCLGGR